MTDDSKRVRDSIRPVRMSDSLWTALKLKAKSNGTSASAVMRRAAELYIADKLAL